MISRFTTWQKLTMCTIVPLVSFLFYLKKMNANLRNERFREKRQAEKQKD